jgi:hypothetical protein
MSISGCKITELLLADSMRSIQLENEYLSATILVDKGADIYRLEYKPQGIDVLWKSPWGLASPKGYSSNFRSMDNWLELYEGGWQVIFPNGGEACDYKGVELNFHGEASLVAWNYKIIEAGGDRVEVRLSTRLRRSPFRLERTLLLEAASPILTIREKITNESGETLEAMWGHHPAYGAPFLGSDCRLDIGAAYLRADDRNDTFPNPLTPGERYRWSLGEREGRSTDLSLVPGEQTPRHLLAYFDEFDSGWYALTNTKLGFGIGLVWDSKVFPYAWFWQEMHASSGFPWYKEAYVMAVEPFSSYPSQGLANVINKTGTQQIWQPRSSRETELKVLFYESTTGIERIEPDGKVWKRAG